MPETTPANDADARTLQHWKDRAQDRGRRIKTLERENDAFRVRTTELEAMLAEASASNTTLWMEAETMKGERDLVRNTLVGERARRTGTLRGEEKGHNSNRMTGGGDTTCQRTPEVGDGLRAEASPCELRESACTDSTTEDQESRVSRIKALLGELVSACIEEYEARGEDVFRPDFRMVCANSAVEFGEEYVGEDCEDSENRGERLNEPTVCSAEISLDGGAGSIGHIQLKTKVPI